MMVSM